MFGPTKAAAVFGRPKRGREPVPWRYGAGDDAPAGSRPASHVTDWMTVITNPGRALVAALTTRCPALAAGEMVGRVIQRPVPGSVLSVEESAQADAVRVRKRIPFAVNANARQGSRGPFVCHRVVPMR